MLRNELVFLDEFVDVIEVKFSGLKFVLDFGFLSSYYSAIFCASIF